MSLGWAYKNVYNLNINKSFKNSFLQARSVDKRADNCTYNIAQNNAASLPRLTKRNETANETNAK